MFTLVVVHDTQEVLCVITSHAQNSPPSLIYKNFSQTFYTFVLFSLGYSIQGCLYLYMIYIKVGSFAALGNCLQ